MSSPMRKNFWKPKASQFSNLVETHLITQLGGNLQRFCELYDCAAARCTAVPLDILFANLYTPLHQADHMHIHSPYPPQPRNLKEIMTAFIYQLVWWGHTTIRRDSLTKKG